MVSRIFNVDSVGDGYRASLVTGGNALVRATAMVASEDSTAIYGSGSTMVVNVLGEVAGDRSGISLGQAATHHDNKILIGAGGYVVGFQSAISMIGYSATIENRGSIWSSGTAISMTGNGAGSYTSKITNVGIIEAHIGIQNLGANGLSFKNSGILTVDEDSYSYRSTLNSVDKIVNTGTINGKIQLGAGNDSFEGSGTLIGDLSGGDGNDTITITKGTSNVFGDDGNDTISAAGTISGGDGNDTLSGSGNIYGDAGNDIIGSPSYGRSDSSQKLYGGTGDDIYYASVSYDEEGPPQVFEASGEGNDTIYVLSEYKLPKNVEVEHLISIAPTYARYTSKLTGNNLAQSITGSAFSDILDGGGGTDKLTGLGGNDTYVINGSDTVVEAANGGTDVVNSSATYTLVANVENLTLTGSSAINGTGNSLANAIIGNNAANTLSGGIGADVLSGALGADIFLFKALSESTTASSGQDTITDFNHKQGDVISLSAIDANSSASGNQAFLFKGTAAFSGAKGELRYEKLASDTYVYADVNGDKIADLTIHLDLAVTLVAGDFTL